MFQYEIYLLKSGVIVFKHMFIHKHYQITIIRAEINREELRNCLRIFISLRIQKKAHLDKIVNDKGIFYTVKIFN